MTDGQLAILVPVWHNYRWLAPFMARQMAAMWPSHPPLWFCGLRSDEGDGLPLLPWRGGDDRTNWSAMLRDGILQLEERGVECCYLIAEEHLPLRPCHEKHLNETLPALMASLPAVYISLMGWDNRRFTNRSPILGPDRYSFKHLTLPRAPRFHLHPALWKLCTLKACCELALQDPAKNGSAWHFEKINDRAENPLPAGWKQQCYQIKAEALAMRMPSPAGSFLLAAQRAFYHKLMALRPHIPVTSLGERYMRAVGFDDFFCDGPYPMFFSGVMAKGGINLLWQKFMNRSPELRDLAERIIATRTAFLSRS